MRKTKKQGFTLIELLTVVAIIALLIGILVPAVNQAMKRARRTAVQAQLYGIGQGLEMFKGDFGFYPRSCPQDTNGEDAKDATTGVHATGVVQGAHRMAFSLMGRDGLGCPARSGNDPNKVCDGLYGVYYSDSGTVTGEPATDPNSWGNPNSTTAKKTARRGPYVDTKGFVVVQDKTLSTNGFAPLLADKYEKSTEDISTTSPYKNHSLILYYAANERGNYIPTDGTDPTADSYYYSVDNEELVDGNFATSDTYAKAFYSFIKDEKATIGAINRPYNPESFILVSRGWDGIYGTDDDVTNWER